MKVYIVIDPEDSKDPVVGVYSTRKQAENTINEYDEYPYFIIEENLL